MQSGLIQLNLSQRVENPEMRDCLDAEKVVWHIAQGNIRQVDHPDGRTHLFTYTEKCARERLWDRETMACRGIIAREGKIIARPWGKFFQEDTKGLPETKVENFPAEMPEITEMLDGEQCVVYEGSDGKPALANRYGFVSPAIGWGSHRMRTREKSASWPGGVTPVVQVVGDRWRRVRSYAQEQIYVVALIRKTDGSELSYDTMEQWCGWNDMLPVPRIKVKEVGELSGMECGGRGWVLRWIRKGEAPFRVILRDEGYEKLRNLLRTVTPSGLCDLLRQGAELGPLEGEELPENFRAWIRGQCSMLRREAWDVEMDAKAVWRRLDTAQGRDKVWDSMLRLTMNKTELRPILADMMYGRDPGERIWAVVKGRMEQKKGWEGGRV